MTRVLLLLLLCRASCLWAQDFPRRDFQLEKLADEIFPLQEQDINYGELYENLAQLLANPLDLNQVTREQLRALMTLTEEQISELLFYRQNIGPLLSVYELQSIPAWNRATFEKVIPFVKVKDSQTNLDASILSRLFHEHNNYLLLRYERTLEGQKGYKNTTDSAQRYVGSPDKMYVRFRVTNPGDFSFGLTAEKDAGEALRWDPAHKQYGPDYISFHAQLQNKGKIRNLILGDFQCQFGQGLILGSVFGFGKNSETVTTVRRSNLGFLPYTSVNENLFFRGAAVSIEMAKGIVFHGFVSDNYKDGNIDITSDETTSITSLANSGLHRTPSEIQTAKQVHEQDAGLVVQLRSKSLDAGIIFHWLDFSRPLLRNPTPYNQFAFQGNTNQNAGIYLNYSLGNVTFFTESAQTVGHGRATTAGILGNITSSFEVSILLRDFAKDYYSFNANAFSENTSPQNEKGIYAGYKYLFNRRYSVSGYIDLFQFPWLRYRGYAPSDGSEWLLRFNYSPSRQVMLFLQAREESKSRNLSDQTNLYKPVEGVKRNYWINCDYAASKFLSFKTRVQFSTYELNGVTTRGIAIVQDVNFSFRRWSFSLRHALFDTDSYDNRLYLYEHDVWLAYSFPAYFDSGTRNYAMVQFKLSPKIDLWLRWSQFNYYNRSEIGSAGETLAGNQENDVKFQARIRF